jgi:hypothetical protein
VKMVEICNHRHCAIPKLLLLIRMAADQPPNGMTEDEVLTTGLKSLMALGVSQEEIFESTLELILSPVMGHVEDDTAVTTRESEDPEWKPCPNTDTV